jgi:hypothetical protein
MAGNLDTYKAALKVGERAVYWVALKVLNTAVW